jgi:DNA polymerase-4/protein ImuB
VSSIRLGWGKGKFVAWVAASKARLGEGVVIPDGEEKDFLSAQSIAVLPMHADSLHRLWRLGIKTLGQLTTLPEEAIVSQFGREGRHAWRLARGLVAEPVTGRETPEPIVATVEFPLPVADRLLLAYAIERLVEQALRHPRRTGWRVVTARVRTVLEQGASWMTEATLKDPSADPARIAAPLLVRLEHTPPTGAVEEVTVEFTAFAPGITELQLFARDAQAAARAGRRRALRAAAGEIKTRLHRSMLYRVIEVHPWSRLPERRYALIDFDP